VIQNATAAVSRAGAHHQRRRSGLYNLLTTASLQGTGSISTAASSLAPSPIAWPTRRVANSAGTSWGEGMALKRPWPAPDAVRRVVQAPRPVAATDGVPPGRRRQCRRRRTEFFFFPFFFFFFFFFFPAVGQRRDPPPATTCSTAAARTIPRRSTASPAVIAELPDLGLLPKPHRWGNPRAG